MAPAIFPGKAAYAGAADGGIYDANVQRRYFGTPGEGALLSFPYPSVKGRSGKGGIFPPAESAQTLSTEGQQAHVFPPIPSVQGDVSAVDDAILRSGGGVSGEFLPS